MVILTRKINVDTNALADEAFISIINITPKVQQHLAETYLISGIVTIFLPGTTAAIATIEWEEGLISDFKKMWVRAVPRDMVYKHKFLWEENNGFSHVRASMMGPSLVVPLANKRLILGQFQQVVLQFMGE